jgi:hypothetical protein
MESLLVNPQTFVSQEAKLSRVRTNPSQMPEE